MLTLWDLLDKARPKRRRAEAEPRPAPAPVAPRRAPAAAQRETMRDRYDRVVRESLTLYGVRVRRWRSSMSGCAWEVRYADGRVSRLIEAPRPRGPMSAAVFLHEIGHHAIGFNRYRPRCLEEYHAWAWAIAEMERHGLNITPAVHSRMHESLRYAVNKARRRGLKNIPAELAPFLAKANENRALCASTGVG